MKRRTLPDVAVYAADGTTTVVEVVVWHDLEDKTREVYEQAVDSCLSCVPGLADLARATARSLRQKRAEHAEPLVRGLPTAGRAGCGTASGAGAASSRQGSQNLTLWHDSCHNCTYPYSHTQYSGEAPLVDIEPGDCIIGIFTGVDMPGSRNVPRTKPRRAGTLRTPPQA